MQSSRHGAFIRSDDRAQDRSVLYGTKVLFVVNADWFFLSHRLPVALAARDLGAEVSVAAGDTGRGPDIREHGLRFIPLGFSRKGTNPLREAIIFLRLLRLYRSLRPSLIHHVTIKPVLYGSVAARLLRTPAVINAISGFGYVLGDSSDRRVLRRLVLAAYRVALGHRRSRTIFQNAEDLEEFVSGGLVHRVRAALIRGVGVDCESFSPAPLPVGPPIVLMASRLLWEKGVAEFVEAARQIRAHRAATRFVVVGMPDHGNPHAVPHAMLDTWSRQGIIEWWGPRTDMPDVCRRASVVVLPTYYREGLPKVLVEAAATGRAIVTTDIPGCHDIVRHHVNGLLVPPRDSAALVEAIQRVLDDPTLRHRLGNEGRRMAVEEFSVRQVVHQTIALYTELLEQSSIRTSR